MNTKEKTFIKNFEYDGDIFPIYLDNSSGYYVGYCPESKVKFTRHTLDEVEYAIERWYEKTYNPDDYIELYGEDYFF